MLWSSTLSVSLLLNHVVIGIQTLKLLLKSMEKDYENIYLNGCILSSDLLQTVDVVELNWAFN